MGEWLTFTFALTGRREWGHGTQGVALGSGLVGLSARAGPQTRLFPHNLHQLDISILNTLAASGVARTFGEGLRRSTVAHFARKVRGTNIMANTSQRSGYIGDLWHFRDVSVALTLRAK